MSLLRQIQDSAIDSSINLPTLLRKCKVLASRLGNADFKNWVEDELSGYSDINKLPGYRILNVNSKGHFVGAFNSGLRNADIPLTCMPERFRKQLSHAYMVQSVAALEPLVAKGKGGTLQEPWSPDIVAYFGSKIYNDLNCIQAWKVIPSSAVIGALDAVRTRILNFVLEIEAVNPTAGEANQNSNPVPQDKVHQIFNMYITGNVQNLAPGSNNLTQNATYSENNSNEIFDKLLEALSRSAAPHPQISSASETVLRMKETNGTPRFKQHYTNFISLLADHIQVLGPVVAPFLPSLAAMIT